MPDAVAEVAVPKRSFLREVFSENGEGSASRVMMGLHALVGGGAIIHIVAHTHDLPDPTKVAAITAFVIAPYTLNTVRNSITAFAAPKTP